jgi:2-phospho-L-lactate guanylyltransferase (CobY/MobA/RfbA family)
MPAGCLVLVPLRSFLDPKTRLADVLTLPERADLARRLAGDVLDALDGWDVAVLTDDDDVIRWADQRDVTVARPGIAG